MPQIMIGPKSYLIFLGEFCLCVRGVMWSGAVNVIGEDMGKGVMRGAEERGGFFWGAHLYGWWSFFEIRVLVILSVSFGRQ